MIQAQDLRIGNLVQLNYKDFDVVTKIEAITKTSASCLSGLYTLGCFNPIQLTEEWLLKFGFEKVLGGVGWDKFNNGKIELVHIPTNKGKIIGFYFQDKYKYLLSVHSLQNLFYSLTNEELCYTTK